MAVLMVILFVRVNVVAVSAGLGSRFCQVPTYFRVPGYLSLSSY